MDNQKKAHPDSLRTGLAAHDTQLPVLDGLAVCGPAGRGFRYFPYAVVGIGAKSLALTFMNIDRKCLSRAFLLSVRDSVIQTQYFNESRGKNSHPSV